ncbi:GNAT family N-acetyltransferase [Aquincola sp. S2]|uniref:GNAT family N-acetyltransferase n=1 Tax=Pseudaquabacterium terrae TaxID=2732868 RepID=A0ABX2EUA7_9BURK|nr:GNAT family N-acetyltransferase [Aquabacterium terrae]NRF72119.1 GNAT family N-acetyltransferase [Aquabacterium terrae]
MTTLVPMTAAEFERYLEVAIAEFARDKVASGQWTEASALELSRRDYAELLPQGVSTPGNFIYTIRDDTAQETVGMIWFAVQERGGQQVAYVYDVAVDAEHQRKGHASRAFLALEHEVRKQGLAGIALHVFGHNRGALALYERLGYVPTNINMFKPVGNAGV